MKQSNYEKLKIQERKKRLTAGDEDVMEVEEDDRIGSDRGKMGVAGIGLASTFESRSKTRTKKLRPIFAIGLISLSNESNHKLNISE